MRLLAPVGVLSAFGGPGRLRSDNLSIMSRLLYLLSYGPNLASRVGFEPTTYSLEGCCTIQIVLSGDNWPRGRDSNPRYSFPYTSLAGKSFRPLSHLSLHLLIIQPLHTLSRIILGWLTGIEPATTGVTVWRSTN